MRKIWKRTLAVLMVMTFAAVFPVTGACTADAQEQFAADAADAIIFVEQIEWTWNTTKLYAGTGQVYSFKYEDDLYSITPKNADIASATLVCSPESALLIDNVAKTFIVNPLEKGKTSQTVTLTLYASGGDASCQPATKTITVYDEIPDSSDLPITSLKWNFTVTENPQNPIFRYYDGDEPRVIYYMPTNAGDPAAACQFSVFPESVSMKQVLAVCNISVTSSNHRVIVFDEASGRLIPVGNGTTELTIVLITPKGKVFSDTVTATVLDSPYEPITSAVIGYDKKDTGAVVSYDTMLGNTMTLMNTHTIQLTAQLNDKASLDHEETIVTLDNGLKLKTVKKCTYNWTSSNEKVAVVMKGGKLNILSEKGETTITLTINDNGVEIVKTLRIIFLNCIPYDKEYSIFAREKVQLEPVIQSGGADYTLSFDSTKPRRASVDANGLVTGRRLGKTLITATARDENNNVIGIETYSVKVKYTFGQWMMMIFLFAWIWY